MSGASIGHKSCASDAIALFRHVPFIVVVVCVGGVAEIRCIVVDLPMEGASTSLETKL